jgi:uncharacterized protein
MAVNRDDVLAILRAHRDEIAAMGVTSLALFGSFARDEAGPDSDVDLLVELDPDAHIGLIRYVQIQERISALLGRPVDLVMRSGLKKRIEPTVLAEAIDLPALPASRIAEVTGD